MEALIPIFIGAVLVVSVAAIITLVVMGYKSLKSLPSHITPAMLQDQEGAMNITRLFQMPRAFHVTPSRWVPFGGVMEWLVDRGIVLMGPIVYSFLKAMRLLRRRFGPLGFRYRLPWYLMVGPEGAGSTTMLQGATLDLPIGRPRFFQDGQETGLDWWFFEQGVVLDLKGAALIQADLPKGDDKTWDLVVRLLGRYRPSRALDGIILTIPVTEFFGKTPLTPEQIAERARIMQKKLHAAQGSCGFRLPVYILLTKTDAVPGFKGFVESLPEGFRHQMLGWSNPYTAQTAYGTEWVGEALDEIEGGIRQMRQEIMAATPDLRAADEVFIFPTQIGKMLEGLQIYADTLFSGSAYQEPLWWRGIYLTGDMQGGEAKAPELTAADAFGAPIRPQMAFIDDVLSQKIFAEVGAAYPLAKRMDATNRNVAAAKGAIAGLAVVGTVGLINAWDKLRDAQHSLISPLTNLSAQIKLLKAERDANMPMTPETFAKRVKPLVDLLPLYQQKGLTSIFVPPSWFGGANTQVEMAIRVAFNQFFVRGIPYQIKAELDRAISMQPPPRNADTWQVSLLAPTKTAAYKTVAQFVERIRMLEEAVAKFDTLRKKQDVYTLVELCQFLFAYQLPDEAVKAIPAYGHVLDYTNAPVIKLDVYEVPVRQTLADLYKAFMLTVFTTADQEGPLGKLATILTKFTNEQTRKLPEADRLRQFTAEMSQIIELLSSDNVRWLSLDYFDPGENFGKMADAIRQSKILGKPVLDEMEKASTVAFTRFKKSLAGFKSDLTGSLVQVKSGAPTSLSAGLLKLQTNLKAFFEEPFMAEEAEERPLITRIPSGASLHWNAKVLGQALTLIAKFEKFTDEQLPHYPVAIQDMLVMVAKRKLARNLEAILGKAQVLSSDNDSFENPNAAEDILRTRIRNMTEANPGLVRILETLTKNGLTESFSKLRGLTVGQAYAALQKVDTLLTANEPYTPKSYDFTWWDGVVPLGTTGFGLRDGEDLKRYLDSARSRMQALVQNFAEPVVQFLDAPVNRDAEGNTALLSKWSRIVDQVNAYLKKKPDNSIVVLETFLGKEVNDINLKNCFQKVQLHDVAQDSGDFFLDKKINFRRNLYGRCEVVRRKISIEGYRRLTDFFNDKLSGKFPFSDALPGPNTPEAEPADLKQFFQISDTLGATPEEIVDQVHQLGGSGLAALNFLQGMKQVRELFSDFVNSKNPNDVPSLDLEIDFRVNEDFESDANLIIDWTSTIDGVKVTNDSKKKVARWKFGVPLEMTFRWPETSDQQPSRDQEQPLLVVDNRTAIFNYPNRWSLFTLLRGHTTPQNMFRNLSDPTPYTLKFEVPTGPVRRAIAFNRVTVVKPSGGDGPGKIVFLPQFPSRAPLLADDVLSKENEAVLAKTLPRTAPNPSVPPEALLQPAAAVSTQPAAPPAAATPPPPAANGAPPPAAPAAPAAPPAPPAG